MRIGLTYCFWTEITLKDVSPFELLFPDMDSVNGLLLSAVRGVL